MDKFLELEKKVKELFEEAKRNEWSWLIPETYPDSEEFRRITSQKWGAKKRSYGLILSIIEDMRCREEEIK
jgi:hypothetical protein